MEVRTTKVFKAILKAWVEGKRRVKLEGGTWSSKTYSVIQALQVIADKSEIPLDISIVSESLPHLKQGCIRDFFNILGESKDNNPFYNKTDHIYTHPDWKGVFQFFGADDDSKVRGPRRHILFINEANNIPWETARALDIRTELFTILDWNPVGEFWAHENWLEEGEDAYDHSTYLDAVDVIPESKVAEIESYRDKDPNWWNIYGLGLMGKIEGLVYPHFEQVASLPLGEFFYGLDFGFAVDPTVLVKNVILGDKLYSQEILYDRTALTNDQIAMKLSLAGVAKEPIYPDPNEPKSAEELRKFGFNVVEAVKGKGSVEYGIQKVNQFYQHWTKDSVNCIKEQRNFRYLKDKTTGELTDKTTHNWSHCLVAGTLVLTKRGKIPIESVTISDEVLTRQGWRRVKASGMTIPNAEVRTISFSNGQSLTGTSGHKIFIKDKGFIPLNSCRYGDIIVPCKEKQSLMQEFNITDTQILKIGQNGIIIDEPETGKTPKQIGYSIDKYGLMQMVKCLAGIRYIIKMAIRRIILCLTSLQCPFTSIKRADTIKGRNSSQNTTQRWLKRLKRGILPLKVLSGIEFMQRELFSIVPQPLKLAPNAGGNLQIFAHYHRIDSAQVSANQSGVGTQALITKSAFALSVGRNIQSINTPRLEPAPVYVVNVSDAHPNKQAVYDLTVDAIPEFFANGILVHNSMDARRYAVATHKLSGISGKMPVWRF